MSPDSGLASKASSTAVGQKVTLHIGVLEQNYRTSGKKSKSMNTGDVATILEAKYGLFSAFYKAHERSIADGVAKSMKDAMEALMMGHAIDPWGPATQQIQAQFRDFISSGASERVGLAGVPTKAALMGVNHRLLHPRSRKNPRRPSFRDTGLLMSSCRSWISVG